MSAPETWGDQRVLDHGYVKLIDSMGTDETIIEAARMSTGKGFLGWGPGNACEHCNMPQGELHDYVTNEYPGTSGCKRCGIGVGAAVHNLACNNPVGKHVWTAHKGDASLLEFLYKNNHHTPFEMCELTIEVKAPIFVFREWHRHRTQSFNEFSARYSQMENVHYVPALERFTPKATGNKQADSANAMLRVPELQAQGYSVHPTPEELQRGVTDQQTVIYEEYDRMLAYGVPKEVARINTPVSRYSKMRAKTDLRNWLGFLKLRLDSSAQWEIRQYAEAVAKIVKALWPRTWALFDEYTLGAVTFSKGEIAALRMAWSDMGPGVRAEIEKKLGKGAA